MAINGIVNTSAYDKRYLEFAWERASYSTTNNTTTINWTLTARGSGNYSMYHAAPFEVTIDGKQIYYSNTRIQTRNGDVIATGTHTIAHNTDGTKSISISVKAAIYYKSYNCTGSGTFTLDAIPRAATITSATNFTDEQNPSISYSNPAGAALEVCISLDGVNAYIGYKTNIAATSGNYTFALTDAERILLRQATNSGSNSRQVYFILKTTIGANVFTNSKQATLTIVNTVPEISATVLDINPDTVALTGNSNRFINGHSIANYSITATPKKEATISKYYATNGSNRLEGASGTIYNVDGGAFAFSVIDTRGNAPRVELEKEFINYVDVTCSQTMKIELLGETQAQITVTTQGNYFNGSFGNVENELIIQARYKENSGSYGNWFALTEAGTPQLTNNTYKHTTTFIVPNYDSKYTVEVRALDLLTTATAPENVITLIPVFDWSATDFNFNVPIHIKGAPLDYVVEQGTANSWYYRRWSSGVMECWRRYQLTTNVTNAWGSLYTTGALSGTNMQYPYPFKETPVLNVSLAPFGSGGIIMATGNSYGDEEKTGMFEIARGTSASNVQFLINYHAVGRYK